MTASKRTKLRAIEIVGRAVRDGRLVRPSLCSKCGSPPKPPGPHTIRPATIQAHHEDHTKPLDVVWLCARCHVARHVELGDVRLAHSPLIGPLPLVIVENRLHVSEHYKVAPLGWWREAERRTTVAKRATLSKAA